MSMKYNDFASVTLTKLGADVLNEDNKRFNIIFKRGEKTDYKEGDIYSNILWVILEVFSEYYENKDYPPFTVLEKMI